MAQWVKDPCHQAWQPELESQDSHGGRRINSFDLIWETQLICMYTIIINKQANEQINILLYICEHSLVLELKKSSGYPQPAHFATATQ